MILADSSLWIDHLRRVNAEFASLLDDRRVACHPFVIGELACGTLAHREEFLRDLEDLPRVRPVAHEEVLALVDRRSLMGLGIGWVDVHLLAAALVEGATLWTLDRRLAAAAVELGVAYRGTSRD